ncbi:hypothetical protein HAX54_047988, partial [Datura stramonium]|nr:hypothetical protein [Datura stramonium]
SCDVRNKGETNHKKERMARSSVQRSEREPPMKGNKRLGFGLKKLVDPSVSCRWIVGQEADGGHKIHGGNKNVERRCDYWLRQMKQ